MVLIKLGICNAFNSVHQDDTIEVCTRRAPSLLWLAMANYTKPNELIVGDDVFMSETSTQQGNNFGPVLHALSIDDITRSVTSPINVWYLDDATIGGTPSSVKYDLVHVIAAFSRTCPDINLFKSEVINTSCDFLDDGSWTCSKSSQKPVTQIEDLDLLSAPLREVCCRRGVSTAIEAHPALFL